MPHSAPVPRDDEDLEKLAARGREIRAREEAARSTPDDDAAASRKRARVAVSAYARWGWVVVALAMGGSAFTLALLGPFAAWTGQDDVVDVIGAGTVGVALLVCFLARAPLAERAIAREEGWARALPFSFAGHVSALGARATEGRFVLVLTFAGPEARSESAVTTFRTAARANADVDDALVADALRAVGAKLEAGAGVLERRIETTFEYEESSPMTNAHVRAWLHRVVTALVALHGRHPIAHVEVRGFTR